MFLLGLTVEEQCDKNDTCVQRPKIVKSVEYDFKLKATVGTSFEFFTNFKNRFHDV